MKRNWKTVRTILEEIEDSEILLYAQGDGYLQDGISEDEFLGHLEILEDAGIIRNCSVRRAASGKFANVNLSGVFITMAGHDLLDALRDATVWGRISRKAADAGVAISWEFIKAAIPAVMKELVS